MSVRFLLATLLLSVVLAGLVFEQSVGLSRTPLAAYVPTTDPIHPTNSTVELTSPGPISFHTIMFVYANGGVDPGLAGRNATTNQVEIWNTVWEINDRQDFASFYFTSLRACGWPPGSLYCPPLPQVDFDTRTVLLVSPGEGTWGDNFTLTSIFRSGDNLQLRGVETGPGLHCYEVSDVVAPILIVDIPKTHLTATLTASTAQRPPCSS